MKTILMNLMKTLGLTLVGSTLLISSCKKEEAPPTPPPIAACQVTKAYTYVSGSSTPSDSAIYTYSGTKLNKLSFDGDFMTLEYTGDKITRRNFMTAGSNTPDQYDVITYNQDGTMNRVESYGRMNATSYQPYARVDFAYASGKISKMIVSDLTSGTAVKETEYAYTFTGDNISQVAETDYSFSPVGTTTYNYTYDNNNNYYKKQNNQALLIDPYLGGVDGLFLPVFFSNNNTTSLFSEDYLMSIQYTSDDRQNLKSVSIGKLTFAYNYLCP